MLPDADPFDLAIVSAAFVGALVGFLWWNAPKANVFMGDVGSMAIGGVIAAMAILTRTELLAVLVAGVFIIGPGSVILQRLYFKATRGKRLFLMSPFHHHLEMRGWSEITHRRAHVDHRRACSPSRASASSTSSGSRRHERAPVRSRLDALTSWHADWKGLRVAVLGLSVTGFSAADTLAELGADVLVVTEKADEEYERLLPVIGARLWTGPLDRVPQRARRLRARGGRRLAGVRAAASAHPVGAARSDVALWGDIELAWRVRDKVVRADGTPADWVLVTGTNGKTTTTRLTATMLVEGGLRAAPVGNIGTPVLDAVRDPAGFDVLVVELSSHQLWYLGLQSGPDPVSPHASVCLNLADDHLEWHGSAEDVPRREGARVRPDTRSRASTTRRMPRPGAWSKTPTSSRGRVPSASISASRVRATSASSTASSSTARSSTTAAPARSS